MSGQERKLGNARRSGRRVCRLIGFLLGFRGRLGWEGGGVLSEEPQVSAIDQKFTE
jgi:hypothetical protein